MTRMIPKTRQSADGTARQHQSLQTLTDRPSNYLNLQMDITQCKYYEEDMHHNGTTQHNTQTHTAGHRGHAIQTPTQISQDKVGDGWSELDKLPVVLVVW